MPKVRVYPPPPIQPHPNTLGRAYPQSTDTGFVGLIKIVKGIFLLDCKHPFLNNACRSIHIFLAQTRPVIEAIALHINPTEWLGQKESIP